MLATLAPCSVESVSSWGENLPLVWPEPEGESNPVSSVLRGSNVAGKEQTRALLPGESRGPGPSWSGGLLGSPQPGGNYGGIPAVGPQQAGCSSAWKQRHSAFFLLLALICSRVNRRVPYVRRCDGSPEPLLQGSCEYLPCRAPCVLTALSRLPSWVYSLWLSTRKMLPAFQRVGPLVSLQCFSLGHFIITNSFGNYGNSNNPGQLVGL